MKNAERLGAALGMIGAFLAAMNLGIYGYPAFSLSSIILFGTALKQKNPNLMALQATFLIANILGIYTFILKA